MNLVSHGTPPKITSAVSREMVTLLKRDDLSRDLRGRGGAPMPTTPASFGQIVQAEIDNWAVAVTCSGATD